MINLITCILFGISILVLSSCSEDKSSQEQQEQLLMSNDSISANDTIYALNYIQSEELLVDSAGNVIPLFTLGPGADFHKYVKYRRYFRKSEIPISSAELAWIQLQQLYPIESEQIRYWTEKDDNYIFYGIQRNKDVLEIRVLKGGTRFIKIVCQLIEFDGTTHFTS